MQIKAEQLYLGYDEENIVKNLSMTPPIGKISVILGANGCGKSTLLKSFARLLDARKGQITLDEKSLSSYKTKTLSTHIGLLPQNPVVPEGISVMNLVLRGRYPYQKMFSSLTKKDFDIVHQSLSMMNIEDLHDKNVDELSGGQRQRVWIALSLAQDTDILLLDEPTTYLDISYQIEILDSLMTINKKKNTTIVMVLHDINLAARYADYIYALKEGELIKEGKPEEIITSELMKEVYGLDCEVIEDPIAHSPFVIPKGQYHQ